MRAFSLVELSIVLVILGLLTGGVLSGQSLIRAAELRTVTAEYQRYVTAIQTFRGQYMALPGDMREATRFWRLQQSGGGCATYASAASGSPGVCDGDGNGQIRSATAANAAGEELQVWRHLAAAGLIEGRYSGLSGTQGVRHHQIAGDGANAPASKLANSGWSAIYAPITAGSEYHFAPTGGGYENMFHFGAATEDQPPWGPNLTPEEAWNIDVKLDDGKPAYGKVNVRFWADCTQAATFNDVTAEYRLTETAKRCSLHFLQAY